MEIREMLLMYLTSILLGSVIYFYVFEDEFGFEILKRFFSLGSTHSVDFDWNENYWAIDSCFHLCTATSIDHIIYALN